jgi:hypothetical protein
MLIGSTNTRNRPVRWRSSLRKTNARTPLKPRGWSIPNIDKVSLDPSCCVYGGIVNRLCFWGPMPEATWKRPLLITSALFFLVGIPALFWATRHHHDAADYVLGGFLFSVALFGLMVGINGCDACVARMAGSI